MTRTNLDGSLDRVAVFVVQNATLFRVLFEDEGHNLLFVFCQFGVDGKESRLAYVWFVVKKIWLLITVI